MKRGFKVNKVKMLVAGLATAAIFAYAGPAGAETDWAILGGSPSVDLNFAIDIDTVLLLQVGTDDAVTTDTISFAVDTMPGTGAVAGTSSGANPVPIRVAGLVPDGSTMTLTSNSLADLTDGTNDIPFDQISWAGTGDFSGGTFNGTAAQQIEQYTDSGDRSGTLSFSYANTQYYAAGNYTGTITYTLASP